MSEASTTYCVNHPDRETRLRCNRCDKLICSQCAIQTPTGYRCEECVRGQQKVFDTAQTQDYLVAFLVAALLSFIGGFLAARIGFFTILLAPAAGSLIAEAVRRVIRRRRSLALYRLVAVAVGVGAAPFIFGPIFFLLSGAGLGALFSALWPGLYLVVAASSAYYRLSGIQIGS